MSVVDIPVHVSMCKYWKKRVCEREREQKRGCVRVHVEACNACAPTHLWIFMYMQDTLGL